MIPLAGKIPWIADWPNKASTDLNIVTGWLGQRPSSNLGILTGAKSGIVVIDVDRHGNVDGADSLRELETKLGSLPESIEVLTGNDGLHKYYVYPSDGLTVPSWTGNGALAPGFEIKADGGHQVVIPPSIHPDTGARYEWEISHHPDEMLLAQLPAKWLEYIRRTKEKTRKEQPLTYSPVIAGNRNSFLTSQAGRMRNIPLEADEILAALMIMNQNRCIPPLPEEEVRIIAYSIGKREAHIKNPSSSTVEYKNAADLQNAVFPDPVWIIPGIIPAGLTLLAGRPKQGKSWLALGLCVAVASGGKALSAYEVKPGRALYLALEDNDRRLQQRLKIVLDGGKIPLAFQYCTDYKRADNGGIEDLDAWLTNYPDCRLVVIDTLAKIRKAASRIAGVYADDYAAIGPFKTLADRHGCAVVLIHHTRKMGADDVFDSVSGSTGLTGAADTTIILKKDRTRADAILHVTGRDVEEQELALKFDSRFCQFNLLGSAEEYRISREQQQIVSLLRQFPDGLTPTKMATQLDKKRTAVQMILRKMLEAGLVKHAPGGCYTVSQKDPF